MANFRIPGPVGTGIYTLEVDAGTAALSTAPRPGGVGVSAAASGEPPTGLLYAKRFWRTLASGTVDDIRTREGRWPDGSLMAPNLLRAQRQLYVQRWREAVLASGADSETAAYWAMMCQRMAELLALFDTERGRFLLALEKLTQADKLDDRDKHQKLREAQIGWFSLLHNQAVTGRGLDPDGQFTIGEEENKIVRRAMSEQQRLANRLNQEELQKLSQQAEGAARQPPAEDLMARRRQREALEKLISGEPAPKGAPDDGLPHNLTGLFQQLLGLERQEQLLGGALGGDDWDLRKREAEEVAKAAAKVVKRVRVDAAKQNIADARKRIAGYARLSDKVAKLKAEVLIREQLTEGLQQVLGLERQRQLLGMGEGGASTDSGDGGGASAMGASLSINADDQELNRLAQEGATVYAEFMKVDASQVQDLLNGLASTPGGPSP